MTQLPVLSLNADWTCEYFEIEPDLFEFAASALAVPLLTTWRCEARYDETWAAVLTRRFDLEPTEECVHYWLRIDSVPGRVVLFLNGRRMGEIDGACDFDVTDYVALEDNRITLRVGCHAEGGFGRITLRAVPCE